VLPANRGIRNCRFCSTQSLRESWCGLAGTATPITLTGPGTAMLRRFPGGSRGTCAKAGNGWIGPSGKPTRHRKGATNWNPSADSYRRAGCRRGCTAPCIRKRNLAKRKNRPHAKSPCYHVRGSRIDTSRLLHPPQHGGEILFGVVVPSQFFGVYIKCSFGRWHRDMLF